MKIICVNGSPHKKGSTAKIIDKIIEGIGISGVEVKKYNLGNMKINYCLGCKNCFVNGICIQDDDMEMIMKDLKEAELVIIGSPSYWGDVTGQLKVFFDRNTPYGDTNDNRNVMPSGKKGVSISVRAGASEGENLHIINSIEHYFGHLGITPIHSIKAEGVNNVNNLSNEKLEEAYQIGLSIKKNFV